MQNNYAKIPNFKNTLLEVVDVIRNANPDGYRNRLWNKVLDEMQARFPQSEMSKESLRSVYRRLRDVRMVQHLKRRDDRRMGRITLESRVLGLIKRKRAIAYIAETLGATEDEVLLALANLQIKGYRAIAIYKEDGVVYAHNKVRANQRPLELIDGMDGDDISDAMADGIIRFAVVSDTHIGSIHSNLKSLNKFYKYVVEELGITTVLHVGDVTDGYYPTRPSSVLEQNAVGFQEQLRKVCKEYPKYEGVTTYFITGNHDQTYMRNGMADIGDVLSEMRADMVHLGLNFGRLWVAPKVSVSLIHPNDGSSYNPASKIKEIIDRNPKRRSNVMLIGHYHKFASTKHNGCYGYLVPSFQNQTSFMADSNLSSEVAGMVFTLKVDNKGNITTVTTEYVDYTI